MALLVDVCEEWEKEQKLRTRLKEFSDIIKTGGADFRLNRVLIIVKQKSVAEKITELLSSDGWCWSLMLSNKYPMPDVPNFAVYLECDINIAYLGNWENITLVVNYDFPKDIQDYNKRIKMFHKCPAIHTLFTKEDSPNAKYLIKVLMARKQEVPIKLENLNTKYLQMLPPSKALETGDIDSLVQFIEGKPLGAVPKRKPKEKVPISKKLKNKSNRKYEEKENIVGPKKSGNVIDQSNAIRINEDAENRRKTAPNNSNPGKFFYQQTKNSQMLAPIKAPETDMEQEELMQLEAEMAKKLKERARLQESSTNSLASVFLLKERYKVLDEGLKSDRATMAEYDRMVAEAEERSTLAKKEAEGKPLGAVPKRKSKEKVPISKKLKNKSKTKCEETSKVTTENILTPQKSEYILTHKTVILEADAMRLAEDTEMREVKSPNMSGLENLCLEVNQEVLQESLNTARGDIANETKNSSNDINSKSPDNATYMCKKIQARKMELQQKIKQMEEKKTNINKREDDLVVKHSKEMAIVLNFKTEAEDDMQEKCKKLNVINLEMCSTDTKLNDLKKQIITLEETRAALKFQMEPIEKEIELDVKKINKLKRKQNYLEGLCGTNIDKIKKEKELVALQMISLQNEIRSNIVDIEKFKNSGFKQEPDITPKYKNLQCSTNLNQVSDIPLKKPNPNKEMVIFLKTIIKEKERSLECPVCFETAKIPIYMCSESHLICFTCKLKMNDCPVCRKKYPEELIRNRYAEEDADKLADLYLKMEDMMQMNTD